MRERASRRRWIVLSVHDQNVVLLDRGGELLIMGGGGQLIIDVATDSSVIGCAERWK